MNARPYEDGNRDSFAADLPVDHAVRMGCALFVARLIHHGAAFGANAAATFEFDHEVEGAEDDEHDHQQRD